MSEESKYELAIRLIKANQEESLTSEESNERAIGLINAVQQALTDGIEHYNQNGLLLTTPDEVLQCLICEGNVNLRDGNAHGAC